MSHKYRLVGSAPTLEEIIKLIESKWGWNILGTHEISKGVYSIDLRSLRETRCRIVLKRGRYRFESPVGAI